MVITEGTGYLVTDFQVDLFAGDELVLKMWEYLIEIKTN